eukprot:m.73320 g.73320  ORF g.73320 m.73320 type:complete len:83 (+) comp16123_c0_seq1:854-1102(+)
MLLSFAFFCSTHYCEHLACNSCNQEGIWWHSEEQKNVVLDKLTKLKAAQRPCEVRHEAVTSIYRAEEYHQRYYAKLSAKRKW